MPSIVVFAGVMVVLLFSAVIWINVKYFRQEKQKEYRETLGQEELLHKAAPEPEDVQEEETDPACEQIVIDETLVPLFTNENWKRVFYRLEKTPELLGWIAFQNQIAGGGDRIYDKDFVGVLLSHHDAVKKVQKEIGLSVVHEMCIHGDEGDVWFVFAEDGVWFALFTAAKVNVQDLIMEIHQTLPSHI